jgi:hypothetical protein
MSGDSSTWIIVAVGLLVAVLAAALGFFLIQRLRSRGRQLRADIAGSPAFADDRAHNQIRIARAELEVVRNEGGDLPRAQELLDQADRLLARHENIEAVRAAHDAHDLLVDARRSGMHGPPSEPALRPAPLTARSAGTGPPLGWARGTPSPIPADPASAAPPAPARPPKNRIESHFQMTLLVEELSKNPGAETRGTGWTEAEQLRSAAQEAYAKGDYTEALRLALKGRRRIGAPIEVVPPEKGVPSETALVPSEATPAEMALTEGSDRCPACGRPRKSGDTFCRGCGAAWTQKQCPRCKIEVTPEDTFCGRCGSPLA